MAIGMNGYTIRSRIFTLAQVETAYKKIAKLGFDGPENLLGVQ